ncbi:MAG: hypothetical protein MUE30_18725 [Spirosomaceae bacterium]|jgi:hypothetical protein|nr:hypothetical protein [Spirosomataceae bacterium]
MAYTNISFDDLSEKLGITNRRLKLFGETQSLSYGDYLRNDLQQAKTVRVVSEKARSEWLVLPLLKELIRINADFLTVYSGESLNVDKKAGLVGECDFILAYDTGSFNLEAPLFTVVEAKKNDIELGLPQCAAQLYAANIYNQKRGYQLSKIYGAVTTGYDWLFIQLVNNQLFIDIDYYYLNNTGQLLGVLQSIIDSYKKELKFQ